MEDEDESVDTDADVEEPVDKGEEQDNEGHEAEIVDFELDSRGAHHADCSYHAVKDDHPIKECLCGASHDQHNQRDVGG